MNDKSLTAYGLMAERHWREFCPQMYRRLETEGRLQEMLFEAQETTLDEIEALTRKLETEQRLTPQQAETAAWEAIREKYILLPPEESLRL
jgi:crotonobetainyl-CoA:carnitine CoA-transferase CaiB-like acyl-CoA transferase